MYSNEKMIQYTQIKIWFQETAVLFVLTALDCITYLYLGP